MKLPKLSLFCSLALLAGLAPARAAQDNLPALFGSRITAAPHFAAPIATGDFAGDSLPDRVYFVKIAPASPTATLAPDVIVNDKTFGTAPLGKWGEDLALAIVQGNGKVKTLLTGYEGEDTNDFFSDPMWHEAKPPVHLAKRGSKIFVTFRRQNKAIRNDVLVIETEAGIDTALYWTGKGYAWFQPDEEP
ncbi:hypothetical protein GCM10007874_21840 [Labrys miyagiensis]|uniref:Uncharacterized protein n=1 Tax=Labrys miyagiensis TaxID=346912 RepID=A0ABQ6CLL9_9HYPH|nr:hypothetical protein [Labrys miyagiensis]GLS19167.1 hypothetical protein GCM10007874_21840 [Labrys miyagiensis]